MDSGPHLVCGCLHDVHLGCRDAEGGGGHLHHLGVEPLPHLGAAVGEEDRAVRVDGHQRPALVEVHRCEGNPELDGDHRHAPATCIN